MRNQKQAMKQRRDGTHRHEPPGDKTTPEQQVRPAKQDMHTGGETMSEPTWISRCHEDQQQADQERQPVGFQEADRVVRTREDASPRSDAEKVAQQLKDHLCAADKCEEGAVHPQGRSAEAGCSQLSWFP